MLRTEVHVLHTRRVSKAGELEKPDQAPFLARALLAFEQGREAFLESEAREIGETTLLREAGACAIGRHTTRGDHAAVARQSLHVQRADGVEAARTRGRRGRPVHGGAADAGRGTPGRGARSARAHHGSG